MSCLAEFIKMIFHIIHARVDRVFDMINISFNTLIFVNDAEINAHSHNRCNHKHNADDRQQHIQSATATAEKNRKQKMFSWSIDSIITVIKESDYKQIGLSLDISCRPPNVVKYRPTQINNKICSNLLLFDAWKIYDLNNECVDVFCFVFAFDYVRCKRRIHQMT